MLVDVPMSNDKQGSSTEHGLSKYNSTHTHTLVDAGADPSDEFLNWCKASTIDKYLQRECH